MEDETRRYSGSEYEMPPRLGDFNLNHIWTAKNISRIPIAEEIIGKHSESVKRDGGMDR